MISNTLEKVASVDQSLFKSRISIYVPSLKKKMEMFPSYYYVALALNNYRFALAAVLCQSLGLRR